MDKVTVIFVVYNRMSFLRLALSSLNNQSFVPDEVVVSDDGSQEDILSALKVFTQNMPFSIKYIRQSDQGFRAAKCRNNAIREASGDYLIFVDQDIVSTKNYIKTFIDNRCRAQFNVAYPIRLTEKQTEVLNSTIVENAAYCGLITKKQIRKIHKQYYEDSFEYYTRKIFRTNSSKPKLRGGVCGIYKDDLLKVDGYDENYRGWGNEDDDLGRRLYRAGIIGKNPFYDEYPIHLYHYPFHDNGKRVNKEYHQKRKIEIDQGKFKAINGISNPLGNEKIEVIEIK